MLKARREYVILCTLNKLLHGHYFYISRTSKNKIFRSYIPNYSLRSSFRSLLWQPTTGTNALAYSYIPHACALYNRLPEDSSISGSVQDTPESSFAVTFLLFVCLFVN